MAETSVIEQILNFLIPPAVFLLLGWILYTAFKTPIDQMIARFKIWRENRKSAGSPHSASIQTIEYE